MSCIAITLVYTYRDVIQETAKAMIPGTLVFFFDQFQVIYIVLPKDFQLGVEVVMWVSAIIFLQYLTIAGDSSVALSTYPLFLFKRPCRVHLLASSEAVGGRRLEQ